MCFAVADLLSFGVAAAGMRSTLQTVHRAFFDDTDRELTHSRYTRADAGGAPVSVSWMNMKLGKVSHCV